MATEASNPLFIPRQSDTVRHYRHGHKTAGKYSTEYAIWSGMRARCANEGNPNYYKYGARGVRVCAAWQADFVAFLQDMGRRPSRRHSLDRIDNLGDYEKANCRWATAKEQCRNRRSSRFLTVGAEVRTMAEWSDLRGISQSALHARLKSGWDEARAVNTPVAVKIRKSTNDRGHSAIIYRDLPFDLENN